MLFGVRTEPCLHDPTQTCSYDAASASSLRPWYKFPIVWGAIAAVGIGIGAFFLLRK